MHDKDGKNDEDECKQHLEQDGKNNKHDETSRGYDRAAGAIPVVLTPAKKSFKIWTVGHIDLGLSYHPPDEGYKRFGKNSLESRVQERFLGRAWEANVIMDATPLRGEKDKYCHIDESPSCIRSIVHHEFFKDWLKKFLSRLAIVKDNDVTILIACPRGTKRAVATARVLASILHRNYGYRVEEPNHLSQRNWGRHVEDCNACSDWTAEKEELLAYARDVCSTL